MQHSYCTKKHILHLLALAFFIAPAILQAQPNITRVEYYIDTDPGFGNGTNVSITTSANIQNLVIPLNPESMPIGVHRFYVRAKDANGSWSLTNGPWLFYKPIPSPPPPPLPGIQPKLKKMEYYIDTDPGYGNATPVALDSLTNFSDYVVPINATGLPAGDHTFRIRALDKNGSWSLVNSWAFTVPAALAAPAIVVNSITKTTRCARDSFEISYDATGTYNSGNVFNVQLSNASGSFASPTVIGSYTGTKSAIVKVALPSHLADGTGYKIRVVSTNPVVTGVTNETSITVHDRPYSQTVTGAGVANNTFSYTYSVPTATGSTWQWIAPQASVSQTNNNASLTWNTAGQPNTIQIIETNQYGCIGDTSIKTVNVYDLKIDNIASSLLTPCPAGTLTITGFATGVYDAGNTFTAQLSNASGSFASPVNIGTVSANPVGSSQQVTINATLPFPLANGAGYRVRIISSSPTVSAIEVSEQNIVIDKPDIGIDQTAGNCPGFTADISSIFNTTSLTTLWDVPDPGAVYAGTYQLIVTNLNGCKDTASVTVSNFPKPDLGTDKSITIACLHGTADLTTVYNTASYPSVNYSVSIPSMVSSGEYNVMVTDHNGCMDTAMVVVQDPVLIPIATVTNNEKIANRECTDSDGWTNYYNDNGTPGDYSDDLLLLSIEKNGNNIGTVGDGTFEVKVAATENAGSNSGKFITSPLIPSGYYFYSANRYWNVTATSQPASQVNVRFYYNTQDLDDVNGGFTETSFTHSQLTVYKLTSGNPDPDGNWEGAANAEFYSEGPTPSLSNWLYTNLGNSRHIAEFAVNSFSGGGIGVLTMEQPLPVTLVSFNATALKDKVVLLWSTATEVNSSVFEVQRSINGTNFKTIGAVPASGNSSMLQNYVFNDLQGIVFKGRVVYYRIIEKDLDGKEFYTETRTVKIPKDYNSLHLVYNPVRNEAILKYESISRENIQLSVVDHLGRVVIVLQQAVQPGINEIRIKTEKLVSGIYEVVLRNNNDKFHVRMLKE